MTLNEYLNEIKKYDIIYYESQELINLFSELSKSILGFEIKIIQIKSTQIEPHIVELQDGFYLIWDLYYWELFDKFILEIIACLDENLIEANEKNIKLIIFDYLINRFNHIPALALCIQANRIKLSNDLLKLNININITKEHFNRFYIGNYQSIGVQARCSVFLHEIFHVYFKLYPEKKEEDLKRLQILADSYLTQNPNFVVRGEDLSDRLKDGFNEIFNDSMLTEEMAVDYRALIEMISIYKGLEDEKFTSIEYIKMIHESFKINEIFLSCVTNIQKSWEVVFKYYNKVDSYEELMHCVMPKLNELMKIALSRNTIIPDFLEKLSTAKYGIDNFSNIFFEEKVLVLFDKATFQFGTLDFILYSIEEAIRIINDNEYDPFEAKDILYSRMNNYYDE